MIEVVNLCVTVIAYAPDSFRSVEMLVSTCRKLEILFMYQFLLVQFVINIYINIILSDHP